ncbi:HlyD family efflux transporter periplasmic adaptor subunit [Metallibacterium sp.]|uniref:efflux RND transporter periplasmic adaptor subunit n=1 Tax=Metallibacterium sp. TaxID=2940281 RepID=UPI0026331ACF|nr:HlyD family efflux transporter periplasmic adaptor subunit [Metallibacterium sp.]
MDFRNLALKKQKRRRLWLAGSASALLVLALAVGIARLGPALPTAQRANLWIGTVQRGDLTIHVRADGVLVPKVSRWIAAASGAEVDQIVVRPGAQVSADSVLMRLSNPEVQDRLSSAQAGVAEAEADLAAKRTSLQSQLLDEQAALAAARAAYASAKIKVDADATVAARGIIPMVQYKQRLIALKQLGYREQIEQQRVAVFGSNIRAQLAAVQAALQQQRSNLALRQRQLAALTVRAGLAGVVQEIPVQEGQQVAPGANLARVADTRSLMARLQVPEVQAKDVALAMPVSVDTHDGLIDGTVTRIDPAVHEGSVRIEVNLRGKLPPGARPDLSVEGRIRVMRLRNVLWVGRPALGQSDATISLFRLDPGGDTATRVPVQLGAASIDRVQILKGLAAGDKVILSDTSIWDKYNRIRIQ